MHKSIVKNLSMGKCQKIVEIEIDSLNYKYLKIFFVVSFYWIVSISTVFVNKEILSSKQINLEAPLFLTWVQCVISTLICVVLYMFGNFFPSVISLPKGKPFKWNTFQKILPLTIVFISMIALNNLCLKYVGVAFYYVGRSLTTVFNVILTFLMLGQKTSGKCILCCAAILFGFYLGVDQESFTDSFSWKGTIFGVLASFAVSLYSIYTKKSLPLVHGEIWLLTYYNNLYSCILFLPLIVVNGEFTEVLKYEHYNEYNVWLIIILSGICGFTIGYATILQIMVTSPLTHNISGTAKACAQTVIATYWYQDSKSILWWSSNIIVLIGSGFYARIKQIEMEQQHKQNLAQKI